MKKQLYFTNEQSEQVERLMKLLEAQNVDLKDQRSVPSISKLFRYLVEKELNEIERGT